VSAIARKAGVDRSLLYRHRDLHALVIAKAAEPPVTSNAGPAVSRSSLLADLAGAHDRTNRLAQENTQLRRRLSEALGEQAWQESGLGGPDDIHTLHRRVSDLEQQAVELRRQLAERDDELAAARAANRELMTALNRTPTTR
jgi:transposase-like protein